MNGFNSYWALVCKNIVSLNWEYYGKFNRIKVPRKQCRLNLPKVYTKVFKNDVHEELFDVIRNTYDTDNFIQGATLALYDKTELPKSVVATCLKNVLNDYGSSGLAYYECHDWEDKLPYNDEVYYLEDKLYFWDVMINHKIRQMMKEIVYKKCIKATGLKYLAYLCTEYV